MKDGVSLIAAERVRQRGMFTAEDDDLWYRRQMPNMAEAYLRAASVTAFGYSIARYRERRHIPIQVPDDWMDRWDPSSDPIRNLVKAGALIAAEIDRLLRQETT